MLLKMPSLRHAFLFSILTISIIIIYINSGDIQPASYLPTISSSHNNDIKDAEVAEMAQFCQKRHSILYADIESTEAYWDRMGGMTAEDLEQSRYICERDGNCPILKLYNGQIYIRLPITKNLSFQSRAHSMLLLLSRVDFSYHENADFLLDTNDGPRVYEPCFLEMNKPVSEAESTSREIINHFLMPDFTSYDWWEAKLPGFTEARLNLAQSAGPFEDKIPKLLWRGVTRLQQGTQRSDLVNQLGPKTDVADVASIDPKDFEVPGEAKSAVKTLEEMCQYQYIVYTEGVAYSGRLKYTSLCNSVQIGHKLTFIEFWSHLLQPYYVNVTDWDDALRIYKELRDDPPRAAALAKGTSDIIREQLSPTGISCYIRQVMTAYARSMRWQVLSPHDDISGKDGNGTEVDYYNWIPLEHFLAKMTWAGTKEESEQLTKPITWFH